MKAAAFTCLMIAVVMHLGGLTTSDVLGGLSTAAERIAEL